MAHLTSNGQGNNNSATELEQRVRHIDLDSTLEWRRVGYDNHRPDPRCSVLAVRLAS